MHSWEYASTYSCSNIHHRESFRRVLGRIGEFRSLLPPTVIVMGLTATGTKNISLSL